MPKGKGARGVKSPLWGHNIPKYWHWGAADPQGVAPQVDFSGISGNLLMEKGRRTGKVLIPGFLGRAGAVLSQTLGIPRGSGASGVEQNS